jgi:hypothetical protein
MDTTTPPQPVSPSIAPQFRLGAVIRDVAIISVLGLAGGFAIGVAAGWGSPPGIGLAALNLLLVTLGFVISGCLAIGNRWRHLAYVALGVWLAGSMNVVFYDSTIVEWLLGAPLVALMMGLGGAISYLFKKDTRAM